MLILNNIFYMYSEMDNGSQILLFLIVLVALMLVSIFIINLITKKKSEKYDRLFNPIDKYTKVVEKNRNNNTKKLKVDTIKKEVIKNENNKSNIEEKNEEIEVMEDPEVVEIVSSEEASIDKISMLLEDTLNNPKPIDLTKFEEEEERNAIISYDELVKKAGAKKIVYKAEKQTINEPKKEEKIEIKEEPKGKFKASQIISPIYGIKKTTTEHKDELEEFIDIEDIPVYKNSSNNATDEEMQKDITFLTNLKTFRSNLD